MILRLILFLTLFVPILNSASFAQEEMVVIKTTEQEREILDPYLRKAVIRSSEYFKTEHAIALHRPIQLIISRDYEFIKATMLDVSAPYLKPAQVQKMLRNRCNPQRKFDAFASVFFITFCLSPHVELDKKWEASTRKWLDRTVAHEITHVLQRQISGADLNNSKSAITGRRRMGPNWMIEGLAEHFHRDIDANRRTPPSEIKRLSIMATRIPQKLRDFQISGTVQGRDAYTLSYYASYLLAKKFGEEAHVNYWRALGKGLSWDEAFKEAFGIELENFLDTFEELRFHATKALEWTKAP